MNLWRLVDKLILVFERAPDTDQLRMTQEEDPDTDEVAEEGDAAAQNNLGLMYYQGRGTPQNYKQALNWFTKAAEQVRK